MRVFSFLCYLPSNTLPKPRSSDPVKPSVALRGSRLARQPRPSPAPMRRTISAVGRSVGQSGQPQFLPAKRRRMRGGVGVYKLLKKKKKKNIYPIMRNTMRKFFFLFFHLSPPPHSLHFSRPFVYKQKRNPARLLRPKNHQNLQKNLSTHRGIDNVYSMLLKYSSRCYEYPRECMRPKTKQFTFSIALNLFEKFS